MRRCIFLLCIALWITPSIAIFELNKHLTTKSPYWPQQLAAERTAPPPGCRAVFSNLVARHGSRNPSKKDIIILEALQTFLDQEEHAIPNKEVWNWLISWVQPYNIREAGQLQEVGEEELYNLAKRLVKDYPDAFILPSISREYPIRTTAIPRAARSGNAFGFALFEGRGRLGSSKFKPFYTLSDSKNSDARLRFFKMCPRYESEVLESPHTYYEADKFLELHAPRVSQRISRLLNISSDLLTASRLLSMWKACLFEFSLSGNANHWCSVFNQEEFEMFEFHADLKRYYESGYGAPATISSEIACELMKDIITLMDARVDHDHKVLLEHASLRFAHAETIIPFTTFLGLHKDNFTLRHDSSPEQIENRKWRTSSISPYAANINFLLWNCTDTDSAPSKESFLVQILMNEKEVALEQCNNQLFCPYDVFKSIFSNRISTCNLTAMCALKKNSDPSERKISPRGDSSFGDSDLAPIKFFATLIIGALIGFGFAAQLPSRESVYVVQRSASRDYTGTRKRSLHGVEEHIIQNTERADINVLDNHNAR